MDYLLDTHVLLWTLAAPEKVPGRMRSLIEDASHRVWFSAASIWEIAIKHSLGRDDFPLDPKVIWKAARQTGLEELAVTAEHAVAVDALPLLHRDPFDRILVAQARVAGIKLLTLDSKVNAYFTRGKRVP